MASRIDTNKPPQGLGQSITSDWTSSNNQSDPFYLKPETKIVNGVTLNLESRYAVTVVTTYKSAGKSRDELDERINTSLKAKNNKEKGFIRILNFYDKNPGGDREDIFREVVVEGWDIKPRPNSRLKILVSIAARYIDELPNLLEGSIGLENAAYRVTLNTEDLYKKINNVRELLNKYDAETRDLFGRIPNLNFKSQAVKINESIPALAKLMLDNEYEYSRGKDQEIVFGMTSEFKPSYVVLVDNECAKPLDIKFDNFRRTPSFSDSRNNKLLYRIDEIDKEIKDLEKLPIQQFIDKYIFNPPEFDFSTARSFSEPEKANIKKEKEKIEKKTSKTYTDYTLQERTLGSKEFKDELRKNLESASEFVGDNIIGGLRELSNLVPTVNNVYGKVLNKVPIKSLIEAALECLNFRGLELLTVSKKFLNQAAALADEIKTAIFDTPTIYLKDDLPITDYLVGIYESIKNGIINALLSTLFQIVTEIIKTLLDYCKECALQNETAGRGRFDGLNFGGLNLNSVLGAGAQSLVAGAVGAIGTGLTSTRFDIPGGQSTSVAQQQQKVIASTQRYAKNPLLMPGELELFHDHRGVKDYVADEKLKEELTNQANQAKQEMGGFLDAASTVLTPGEAGNMMLGCGASQDAIDVIKDLASNYPTIEPLMQTDDDILEFFNDIGKISGYPVVLETIKEITDNLPEEYKCLCDPDDEKLRQDLLNKKDMSPELIQEQIQNSNDRNKKRLEELNALLEKENILDGMVPPIYCSYDPKTGKTIPGIINRDHPKFDFTLNQTLDTLYDGVASAFNNDVLGYLPTVTLTPTTERIVPRTVQRTIGGSSETFFNNEFLDLVGKGQYSFGCLPPGTVNRDGDPMENKRNQKVGNDEFVFVHWLGAPTKDSSVPDDIEAAQQQAIGMTRPLPEAEMLYEALNRPEDFYNVTSSDFRKSLGGRSEPAGFYTKKFGFSPVPIIVKERGQETYAPGFQETYRTFCYGEFQGVDLNKLKISRSIDFQKYKFEVPNKVLDNLNIDLETLKGSVAITGDFFNEQDTRGQQDGDQLGDGFREAVSSIFGKINDLGFSLNYFVPKEDWKNDGYNTLDRFSFIVAADTPTAFQEQAGGPEQLELGAIVSGPDEKVSRKAIDAINYRNIQDIGETRRLGATRDGIPQDNIFRDIVNDSVFFGPVTYSSGKKNPTRPVAMLPDRASTLNNFADMVFNGDTSIDYYNEVWRGIFCSFANQIGSNTNPFFDLANLNALDFAPMRTEDQDCPPHLLDIDAIKNRIKDEYSVIQCIEASFPNVNGLGSNKDNPFEKANLGGTVLLILRTYIIELFLRSLHVFYWFRYKSPEDVDNLLVLYVGRYITQEIEKDGYFTEFEKEIIDLYERNFPIPDSQQNLSVDYDTAIKFLVRQQIYSVSNRVSKLVGSQGDTSIDTILLQEWIRMLQIPKKEGEQRFNKPCVSISNDIDFIPNSVINTISEGELSTEKIEQIAVDTYSAPVGYFFREYFQNATGSDMNVRNAGAAIDIWSLNPDSDTFGNTSANPLNMFGTRYVGTEPLGNSKKNGNRERYQLAIAGLVGTWDASRSRFKNQDFLRNNWDNLDTSIKYKYGVSPAEKKAMANIIKFTAMAGQPQEYFRQDFSDGTESDIVGGKIKYFYPGWLFKQQFALGKVQTRDAITFPPEHRSIRDSGVRAKTPELGFVKLLNQGLQYQKIGSRSYRFDDEWQKDFDWQPSRNINDATYGLPDVGTDNYISMTAAVVNRQIFFTGDGRGGELDPARRPNTVDGNQVSNDVWQPPPNLAGSLEGDRNLDTLQAASSGRYSNGNSFVPGTKGMLDEATLLKIKDWQVNGNEFEYLSDNWLNATDWYIDFNVSAPRPEYARLELWSGSPYYIKIGESKDRESERRHPFDVLIENFMPRTIHDFSGRAFQFRWRYGYQAWRDEPNGIEELDRGEITELSNDPWFLSKNAPAEFTLSPSYVQYGYPSIDSNRGPNFYNGIYQTAPGTGTTPNAQRIGTDIFCKPTAGYSILNPFNTRGTFHSKLFYHGLGMLGKGVRNMSLLDLDPLSIIQVLRWEQSQIFELPSFVQGAYRTGYDNVSRLTPTGRSLYEKYNIWIQMAEETFNEFRKTRDQRLDERRDLLKKVGGLPPARRPMEQPLTCNFDNGGLLVEPYIRAVELDTDPNSPYNEKVTQSGLTQKQTNANTVDGFRNINPFGRTGIINIEEFDEFIKQIADSINTNTNITRQQTFDPEEILGRACGGPLEPVQSRNYEYTDDVLGNYFEEVHLGLRLSYVLPIKNRSTEEFAAIDSIMEPLRNSFAPDNLTNSKAYFVKESKTGTTSSGLNFVVNRDVNVIPITSMEIPFNMATRLSDAAANYNETLPPKINENGYLIPQQVNKIGFFKATYKRNLDTLTKRMSQTDEYAAMFKYLFPVDRMLGINTIYSSTYLSSMKGIDTVFDATKEQLRQLLFILLDSGNYQKTKCAPSNRQFVESFLNGFDIKGLAGQLALILVKSSVLIFKGFMEAADINIILSRRIIDLIHTANRFIAQSQQLANQASQAVTDTAQGVSDLAESIYDPIAEWATGTSCTDLLGPGSCKSQNSNLPSRPDGTLFDPIDENFIPEPQIWAVSLALLPATLFAPFFLGPPLTIPFGFVYWALDYKPSPNWLNSVPPSDWLNKLLNGESNGQPRGMSYAPTNPNENCVADLGLPPPGANADALNRYYADQTPSDPDPPSELTGSSGAAGMGDPTDRSIPTDSLPGEPPPSESNDATGRRSAVNTGPGGAFDSRLEQLGSLDSWGTQGSPGGVNPFASGQDPSGEGGEGGGGGGGISGPGGIPPY